MLYLERAGRKLKIGRRIFPKIKGLSKILSECNNYLFQVLISVGKLNSEYNLYDKPKS